MIILKRLFRFNHTTFIQLAPHFEAVFSAYEQSARDAHLEARLKLLGLLCHLKGFALERNQKAKEVFESKSNSVSSALI
nr:hypothetical protein [Pedobacter sp. ASV19]